MTRKILILSIVLNIFLLFYIFWSNRYTVNQIEDVLKSYEIEACTDSSYYKFIFIGNSITANWINISPNFFSSNRFLNKGVGGQTSSQILLRFQQDVINQSTKYVVLNIGINDIGEGDGFYCKEFTLDNLKAMIAICKADNVVPILTTILPATEIKKNRFSKISDVQSKIEDLNREIVKLASDENFILIDYNTKLRKKDGTFKAEYTFDGVHPNAEGYKIMENIFLETIKELEK